MAAKQVVVARGSWRENSLLISKLEKRRGIPDTQWSGTCQDCENTFPAVQLRLRQLGWGRGEIWACPACLHPARKEEE